MPKPNLQLIHCATGVRPGARQRLQNGRGFQPLVIDGGVRSVPGAHGWEAALKLFHLGLLALYGNYLAVLNANMTVLNGLNGTDTES